MNILVIGPSGSGKSYVSSMLAKQGMPTVDTDELDGLFSWSSAGKKVVPSGVMDVEFLQNHGFLWDRDFLENYLKNHPDMFRGKIPWDKQNFKGTMRLSGASF